MSFEEVTDEASTGLEPRVLPWYLAYTRPRMEETAVFNCARQGFETYHPLFKTYRSTTEGLQSAYESMFPRYVFLRPANAGHSLSTVGSTRGVCSLVRFGIEPAQVLPEIVQRIRQFELARKHAGLEAISPIQPGARVRMRQGGLKGIEGLVVSIAKQRVTFLLQLLGREKQVTVEHAELELA